MGGFRPLCVFRFVLAAWLGLGIATAGWAKDPLEAALGAPTTHPRTGRSVTFGIEHEFKPIGPSRDLVDELTMDTNLRRLPFMFRPATRENRRGPTSSNNLEVNGLPVSSLDEATNQMRRVLTEQGVNPDGPPPSKTETGARSFHMHIFIPTEFLEKMPPAERLAVMKSFSTRLGAMLMARRLQESPFFALNTQTVGWFPPQGAFERGATRLIERPDIGVFDLEIRGTRNDVALMREFAMEVVRAARDPERLRNPPDALHEAMNLQVQTLPQFLDSNGHSLADADRRMLSFLQGATVRSNLPLHRFDELPQFSEQRARIEQANRVFAASVMELLAKIRAAGGLTLDADKQREFQGAYRDLIQRWGKEVKLTELLGPSFLYPKNSPLLADQRKLLAERAARALRVADANGDVTSQIFIAGALEGSREPLAHKTLTEIASSASYQNRVRIAAAKALHGAPVAEIEKVIERTGGDVQAAAIFALGQKPGPERLKTLLPMLEKPGLRDHALAALASAKEPEALAAIIRMGELPGDSADAETTRVLATEALAGRSDAKSLEVLKRRIQSDDHPIALAAAEAFRGRTDVEAVKFIAEMLDTELSPKYLSSAIEALQGHPSSKEMLSLYRAVLIGAEPTLLYPLVRGVAKRDEPEMRNFRRSLATHRSPLIRRSMVQAMAFRPNDPAALEIVEIGLRDSDEEVRKTALEVLGNRSDADSLRLLEKIVVDQLRPNADQNPWRPEMGPRIPRDSAFMYLDKIRAGRSLRGECFDTLHILGVAN